MLKFLLTSQTRKFVKKKVVIEIRVLNKSVVGLG